MTPPRKRPTTVAGSPVGGVVPGEVRYWFIFRRSTSPFCDAGRRRNLGSSAP